MTLPASNHWEPVKQGQGREGVNTWVRSVEGMAVKAFRGQTEVHQSTLAILALLAAHPWFEQLGVPLPKCSSQLTSTHPTTPMPVSKGCGWLFGPRDMFLFSEP